MAFFDNRIIDADAPSYVSSNTSWQALAHRAAPQKRAKYQHVIEDLSRLWCVQQTLLTVELEDRREAVSWSLERFFNFYLKSWIRNANLLVA